MDNLISVTVEHLGHERFACGWVPVDISPRAPTTIRRRHSACCGILGRMR